MTTTLNASTAGAGGFIATSDNSGVLALQTAGTTAITVDASQRAAFVAGTAALPAITTAGDTNTGIFFPSADTIAFSEGGAEAMRIDSSGNVGIGTASPSYKLDVSGNGRVTGDFYVGSSTNIIYESSSNLNIRAANSLLFNTSGANERMRIDSSGNLLVGTTSNGTYSEKFNITTGSSSQVIMNLVATGTGAFGAIKFRNGSGEIGSISYGDSNVTYNTSSDYRLKHDIQPMTGALEKVLLLKPVIYKWKLNGADGQGFIAHELQEIVPDCVTGDKDATREEQYEVTPAVKDEKGNITTTAVMGTRTVPAYQGIDTSYLVATLTAAIQELSTKNDALTARIVALENK